MTFLWEEATLYTWAFPGGSLVKNLPANVGDAGDKGSIPGSGRSLEQEMATLLAYCLGKSHGQRSLASYSPCVLSCFSRVRCYVSLWIVARQAPLSMGVSRQEYWSGLPFPSSGDLPNEGIEARSSALQTDSLPSKPPSKSTEM